ncbi:protein-L-isoaspartate O-methyltransferase [Sphingomonas donggukensis]|uniref:Protein-L-isoaspartate O-methyltransferase n=1 Tax=Sphingomonas donggukensis TaxID=2949093 RepID=A0ABY4TYF3_9SPHN|nr:protein-L-isoaspartate O-methyltransferase [Sphingomonas donggukensis]URW76681.1 protein-L-isoaspartate O-methyltransferase [Sphingomonas donggukensis]
MMASIAPTGFDTARQAMVASQLRTSAVNDTRVIAAMAAVPREEFVGAQNAAVAYRDTPLALASGRRQNAPLTTGRLLTEARIESGDRVLLIGTAGGYTAAVLARLAASVVAVESDGDLAAAATMALAEVPGVTVVNGALEAGAPESAPFDVLVVDGAVEALPASLTDQVRPGGRIVAGLSDRGVTRLATGVRGAGAVVLEPFADIDCVVLPGFARPRTFQFAG